MPSEKKVDAEQFPDVRKQGWDAEQIAEESANKPSDEIVREMMRGDESQGDADDRDVVGSVESADTPQGREEAKRN